MYVRENTQQKLKGGASGKNLAVSDVRLSWYCLDWCGIHEPAPLSLTCYCVVLV